MVWAAGAGYSGLSRGALVRLDVWVVLGPAYSIALKVLGFVGLYRTPFPWYKSHMIFHVGEDVVGGLKLVSSGVLYGAIPTMMLCCMISYYRAYLRRVVRCMMLLYFPYFAYNYKKANLCLFKN